MSPSSTTATLNAGGSAGSNSVFATVTSLGGGCASYYPSSGYLAKNNGGSGGGAVFGGSGGHNAGNTAGTTAQGFGGHGGGLSNASTWSGGGGGAGAAGNNTSTGGAGLASSITGTSVNRAGGGSPGPWQGGTRGSNGFGGGAGGSATSGTANTGGGGGGGGSTSQSQSNLRNSGSGGSGVVILRFDAEAAYTVSAGLTVSETTDGDYKVLEFTSGTGTITFNDPVAEPDYPYEDLVLFLDASSYAGSGTTWTDLSDTNATATFNSAPAQSTYGAAPNTLNFSSKLVTVTNNTAFDFSSEQSVYIISYPLSNTNRQNYWDQAYGGEGTWTREGNGTINCYFGDSGSNSGPYIGANSSTSVTLNQWQSWCFTRNTSNWHWYKNGVQTNTGTHSFNTP